MLDKKEMITSLKTGIEKLRKNEISFEKSMGMIRNTDNWCFVHATRYLPRTNPQGKMYIPTTAMATDFMETRTTVHATLNHIVAAHGYGSWDDAPIVVLAPYKDVVAGNGNPVEVAGTDTYWSVNPDAGLMLPESAYIVKPDNNGPLFQIGEHVATYKRGNYTDDEISQIESMLDPDEMEHYTSYKNEDSKLGMDFLAKYLRDTVVKLSMEHIGMSWIRGISDASELSYVISDVARSNGVPGNPSNKGHGGSVYHQVEEYTEYIQRVLYVGHVDGTPGIFNTDFKSLYDVLVKLANSYLGPVAWAIMVDLTNKEPIDFLKIYQDAYAKIREIRMSTLDTYLNEETKQLQRYYNDFPYLDEESRNKEINRCTERISEYRKQLAEFTEKQTIADYDKNFWESIRRHSQRISSEYKAWRSELVKHPDYDKLVQKLRGAMSAPSLDMAHGRDY